MTRSLRVSDRILAIVSATALLLLTSTACGHSESAPVSPTIPEPTRVRNVGNVEDLSIAPATDVLRVGGTQQFSATVVSSDGLPAGAVPRWTSTDPAVVSVTPYGNATATRTGLATIEVAYLGRTATRQIQVIP